MTTRIKNGISYNKNGWKYISIHGKPKDRGYAYGYLCAKDFKEIQKMLSFLMLEAYGQEWNYFIDNISKGFKHEGIINQIMYIFDDYSAWLVLDLENVEYDDTLCCDNFITIDKIKSEANKYNI